MKKKGRRGDYFFERSLLRFISFWSSRSPPLLGQRERLLGQKDSSSSLRKKPPTKAQTSFLFFWQKKESAHTKRKKTSFFFFIRFSLCTSADRFKTNTKHTHKREEERKREREGIKARRRRRRGKQRADRYTERKYVWISVSEKVTN
jgi:hypothetical protein